MKPGEAADVVGGLTRASPTTTRAVLERSKVWVSKPQLWELVDAGSSPVGCATLETAPAAPALHPKTKGGEIEHGELQRLASRNGSNVGRNERAPGRCRANPGRQLGSIAQAANSRSSTGYRSISSSDEHRRGANRASCASSGEQCANVGTTTEPVAAARSTHT
jgi:hypothetical protein